MKVFMGKRPALAVVMAVVGLGAVGAGAASAAPSPVTKTFSFIASPGQPKTGRVILNADGLVINARCNAGGGPVIYAFSNADADLFGRVFNGFGRLSSIKQSAFIKGNKGVLLSVNNGDFDASGTVLYETFAGKVVTVNYAFDNATTLNKRKVCTVYGSAVAT
ncbi:MAG: hypothetical protein WAK93_19895 [Solirubrobacteraceae bacterium]